MPPPADLFDIGRRIMMTVLCPRLLGARFSFDAREHRDAGCCVLEGHLQVAAVTFALVASSRVGGRLLI
jgi:hypothetical protein